MVAAEEPAGENLACAASLLGRDDGGELAAGHIPDETARGGVDPADDAAGVDHVARDVDVLQRISDAGVERLRGRHRIPRVSRTPAQDADTSASPPRITFAPPPGLRPEHGERGAPEQDDREDVDQREEA